MKTLRIQKVLFATDFFENSRLALDYTVAFAHHFHATVTLMHAMELPPQAEEAEARTGRPSLSRKHAEQRLNAFAAGVRRTGLRVEISIRDGTPCGAILEAVNTLTPDLLVLGVHGTHRGLDHLFIGSNTEKVVLTAACPTLSVGSHVLAGIDLSPRIEQILYCSDFTPEAVTAARYAMLLGEEFQVPVDVCHLVPRTEGNDSDADGKMAEAYCNALRDMIPGLTDPWCQPEFHLAQGFELDDILNRVESQTAGLIVLGVRSKTTIARHMHTSLAYQLLTRAASPVFSVKSAAKSFAPG